MWTFQSIYIKYCGNPTQLERTIYWAISSSAKKLQLSQTFQSKVPSEAIKVVKANQKEEDDQLEDDIFKLLYTFNK